VATGQIGFPSGGWLSVTKNRTCKVDAADCRSWTGIFDYT